MKNKGKDKRRLSFDEMKKKMNPETQEALKSSTGIGIKGIGYEQKKRFLELSKDLFRGDWGHTLSYLVNYYDDTQMILTTLERVTHLENRLEAIIQHAVNTPKEERGKVKLMGGVEVKRK